MKRVLSGMRPTGKLHLGHWVGALSSWVSLQDKYECFFMVADWHALMSEYKNPSSLKDVALDNVADWISWGISSKKSTIFIQSDIKEHLDLFMVFSILTPLGWLYRCPTFKEQIKQLEAKEINTHAFLGYPVLQSSDILLYKADYVPVGEDQLPHLELAREIVRRFHFIYNKEIFPEPKPLLTEVPRLLGLDSRKMSKSYDNCIYLSDEDETIKNKVSSMITDPQRIRKTDPGRPEVCNVYSYYKAFLPQKDKEVSSWCRKAQKGCTECKGILAEEFCDLIRPRRENKKELLGDKKKLLSILEEGKEKAHREASKTWKEVKKLVGF
ncbi:MAG: tryptophan--tRNA ligase [Candidatus Omnitrophica bacterium]|nr:tryptophan--tRNA ligase [Candidatus Omnitrophota bacterium]